MFSNDKNNKLNKYGRVVESEDRTTLYVYVKQGIIYRYNGKVLSCEGLEDKKVYYIFDGVSFSDRTRINGTNANLIFINCSFNQIIEITRADSIKMQHNKFTFYNFEQNHIELIANEISLVNNTFANVSPFKKLELPSISITMIASRIVVNDSVICTEYYGNINIMANDLLLEDSTINGETIHINADNIITKNSVIVAPKEVTIDNENCNFTCAIKSPKTTYNGINLNSNGSQIIEIDEDKAKLLRARLDLINTLNKVEFECTKENSRVLMDMRERLRNRKIYKVLKK